MSAIRLRSMFLKHSPISSSLIALLTLLLSACSTFQPQPEGPAEKAGKYLDRSYRRLKAGTVEAYRRSRDWVQDTSRSVGSNLRDGRERGWEHADERYNECYRGYYPDGTPCQNPGNSYRSEKDRQQDEFYREGLRYDDGDSRY